MKKINLIFVAIAFIAIYGGCKKKDDTTTITPPAAAAVDNYASMAAFHAQNGVQMQTYTVDGAAGGSFTTPQGTIVSVPANAFKTQGGLAVTGSVTIQFKDIYKKSDMLLSDEATQYWTGKPLKSGGEFFIKAMQANVPVIMATGKKISVTQPLNGVALDNAMVAMGQQDTIGNNQPTWFPTPSSDSISFNASDYVFSLYQFNNPLDSGSWCNSDQAYFAGYTQTTLTIVPVAIDSQSVYHTEVFLLFSNLNSMIHVYFGSNNFPYTFAPLGAQCTAVAVGEKNGLLYSSFVPITITSNLTVNFTLSQTTTAAFKTAVTALN